MVGSKMRIQLLDTSFEKLTAEEIETFKNVGILIKPFKYNFGVSVVWKNYELDFGRFGFHHSINSVIEYIQGKINQ